MSVGPVPAGESAADDPRDVQLAQIMARLMDRFQAGEEPDLDGVCHEHPDFSDDLRDLWGTLQVTRAAGTLSGEPRDDPRWARGVPPVDELPARFGPYDLVEELGRGGMGVVYEARQRKTGEAVALKMMLQGDLATPVNRQRFRAEAAAARGLNHQNIVRITDIGRVEGRDYFCMELIRGETLAQRLERGPMPPGQTARILSQVARAIEYAHQNGVLHRDIKPSNVLIADEDNRPCVVDFGLARDESAGESLTRTGAVIGTPAYMAPEQAAGRRGEVGPASDVYSLGALMYHMLTGRPPFQAASPVDTVLMLLEQDPIMPRILNHEVDRRLEMITMRCLQKPQDLRYRSAAALARDLEAWLNHQPVSAQRGRMQHVITSLLKETHHANVMENWGLLWMWHSLALLVACLSTQLMFMSNVQNRWLYWLLWMVGFGAWAVVFWYMRQRSGPVTLVERQLAHLWLGSILCIGAMFPFEWYLDLPVLTLAPLLAVVAGSVFLVKAGMLAGFFYVDAVILYATGVLMAVWSDWALLIFGVVCSACFFFAGWKYRKKSNR